MLQFAAVMFFGVETCNNSETIMWKILTGCIKHFNLGRLNIKCG